jgi:hypothetical protein
MKRGAGRGKKLLPTHSGRIEERYENTNSTNNINSRHRGGGEEVLVNVNRPMPPDIAYYVVVLSRERALL